jgi:hypothetical protein
MKALHIDSWYGAEWNGSAQVSRPEEEMANGSLTCNGLAAANGSANWRCLHFRKVGEIRVGGQKSRLTAEKLSREQWSW